MLPDIHVLNKIKAQLTHHEYEQLRDAVSIFVVNNGVVPEFLKLDEWTEKQTKAAQELPDKLQPHFPVMITLIFLGIVKVSNWHNPLTVFASRPSVEDILHSHW